eukprot:9470870-Pyramimonas_sp.AAC.5
MTTTATGTKSRVGGTLFGREGSLACPTWQGCEGCQLDGADCGAGGSVSMGRNTLNSWCNNSIYLR